MRTCGQLDHQTNRFSDVGCPGVSFSGAAFSGAGGSGGCTTFGRASGAGVSAPSGCPNAPSAQASIIVSATIEYRASMTSESVSTALLSTGSDRNLDYETISPGGDCQAGFITLKWALFRPKPKTAAQAARNVRRGRSPLEFKGNDHRSGTMTIKQSLRLSAAAFGVFGLLAAPPQLSAQTAVAIDNDDIGGVVTGPNGPEAGVWVIAETTDLPTRYAKMVVTDDQGRYVVPDLPKAQVQGVGARLRPRRLAEGRRRAGQAAQPDRGDGAERGGSRAILSGDLLVLDAEDPGCQPVRRQEATSPPRSSRPTGST